MQGAKQSLQADAGEWDVLCRGPCHLLGAVLQSSEQTRQESQDLNYC